MVLISRKGFGSVRNRVFRVWCLADDRQPRQELHLFALAKITIEVLAASFHGQLGNGTTTMGSGAISANNLHFLDDFSVEDALLGKGGSGKVVQGRHLASSRPVAIKVIDPLQRKNAERARTLFEREVELHSLVSHLPGVVRLLGASPPSSKSRCYLATELASIGDLFVLLKKRRVLSEPQVRDIVVQLVGAVAGLHRNNICHRDIKPENILLERSQLNPRGVVLMVADFGHAGLLPAGATLLYTRDCGTPGYRAPELGGDRKHGHGLAVDLWSVGAVMNDCFSFKPRQPTIDEDTFWTRDIWEFVSTDAKDLLGRLLEADPSKRITADEALRHPWLTGGKFETVSRGISASGSPTSVAGKGTTLNLVQEVCNMNNAANNTIDDIDDINGTTDNHSRPKKAKFVGPPKRMKTENDGDLKQLQLGRIGTNRTDDRSCNHNGPDKIAKDEVCPGNPRKVAECLNQRNFVHPPSSLF